MTATNDIIGQLMSLLVRHHASEPAYKVSWEGYDYSRTWFTPDHVADVGFTVDYGCIFRMNSVRVTQILYSTISNR